MALQTTTKLTKAQTKALSAIIAGKKVPEGDVDGRSMRALTRLGYVTTVKMAKGVFVKPTAAGRKAVN